MEEARKTPGGSALEDLDPAMILSDETPGGLGRAVGALEVIEEVEPSDPEEDDESDYVAGGKIEREEGRHGGRLEELKKMQEFKLYDVVPRQEALEKGWRVLQFRWVDKERPEIWRCRYVVKDFRALQPWRRDLFTPSSLPITNRSASFALSDRVLHKYRQDNSILLVSSITQQSFSASTCGPDLFIVAGTDFWSM